MAKKLTKKRNQAQRVIKKVKKVSKKVIPANKQADQQGKVVFDLPKGEYFEGIGRRKVATARVRIYPEGGDMVVNGHAIGKYFDTVPGASTFYLQPFVLTDTKGKFAITAKVSGSGIRSQLDAVIHGIARALIKFNPDLKPLLKEEGLMTRDDRMKESRKMGMGGKARRKRQSPRR